MSLHLQRFAKEYIIDKPRGYLIALAIACKGIENKGRLSERIREELVRLGPAILKINIERHRTRYRTFLNRNTTHEQTPPTLEKNIEALRVRSFRGFGNLSTEDKGLLINFNSRKNIFFAPNGGGKTSLCEALEYVFTGGIKEAERRRTKISEYVKRGWEKPIVKVKMSDGSIFGGSALVDSCFIDRNRLQEFSLLGSKDTNFQERDVLAALFGLEEIEELISRFVQPRSFVLAACKRTNVQALANRLDEKYLNSYATRTRILESIDNCRLAIASSLGIAIYQKDLVANRISFKKKYLDFKRGKLAKKKLSENPVVISARIVPVFMKRINRAISRLLEEQEQLNSELDSVSFEDLFNAILEDPNAETSETCPACLTPLANVVVNPYERAAVEIKKLSRVADSRERVREARQELANYDQKCKALADLVATNAQRGATVSKPLENLLDLLHQIPSANIQEKILMWGELFSQSEAAMDEVRAYEVSCIGFANRPGGATNEIERRAEEISGLELQLEDVNFHIKTMKAKREELKVLVPILASYKNEKRKIEASLAAEIEFNKIVDEVEQEYTNFFNDLRRYKLKVEDGQIAGIEGKAVEYYRKINDGDDDCEQVSELKFVRSDAGYRIELQMLNGERNDAFACLSEGHLRVLGLSLLLAVASQKRYPFIVFDDVVNAIDSDHRANIISLLYSDEYLLSAQQIITTHDRLFWERYCNAVRSKFNGDALHARTLINTNRGIVVLDHDGGFRAKIEKSLGAYDVRQALIYCRIWFETLVIEYCTSNNLEVTAAFSKRHLKPNNYLTIALESTYSLMESRLGWDTSNIDVLRSDLINWKAQNQEHHAFDEKSLNFVHAKTSGEVKKIFDALVRLAYQLAPDEYVREMTREKAILEQRLASVTRQLANESFVARAPVDVVAGYRRSAAELAPKIDSLTLDLRYAEECRSRNVNA